MIPAAGAGDRETSIAARATVNSRRCGMLLHPHRHDPIRSEGADIGEQRHAGELDGRPAPTAGLAAHDGHGGEALHGKGEEHQQCGGAG